MGRGGLFFFSFVCGVYADCRVVIDRLCSAIVAIPVTIF